MKTATAPNPPANPPEIIMATGSRVGCDGGAGASQGALGHPLVYLTLKPGHDGIARATCGYCDREFVLAAGTRSDGH